MKNRDKLFITLSWLFCFFALLCAVVVAAVLLIPSMTIRIRYFLLCVAGVFLFPLVAVLLRSRTDVNEKVKRKMVGGAVMFMFVFYVLIFLSSLLLTKVFANDVGLTLKYNKYWLSDALPKLVPFSSIGPMFRNFAIGRVSTGTLVLNVGGNLLLYTPLAFFIPSFSKSMRNFDSFLPFMVFLVLAVEMVQGMFGLGSFETDDMILGIGGALLAYVVLNTGPVSDFFKKNYFYA